MKRTRKWAFVEQEATRLATLGLPPADIAARLGVNKSSVTRWMATGKLPRTDGEAKTRQRRIKGKPGQSPKTWASTVRHEYDLDATDEQLVRLAQEALEMSRNRKLPPQVRLSASGRYQALVRQLALVARRSVPVDEPKTDATPDTSTKAAERLMPRRTGDPRHMLQAVK